MSVALVIPGFHPDPSVCRVGDDYYLAKLVVRVRTRGPDVAQPRPAYLDPRRNVLDRPDQFLAGRAGSSRGVYAPTLRHHVSSPMTHRVVPRSVHPSPTP